MKILLIIAILIVVLLAVGFVFVSLIIKRENPKPGSYDSFLSPLLEPTGAELLAFNAPKVKKFNALPTEDVFITTQDGLKLVGKLYRGTENVTVICCHGYKSQPVFDFCAISEMYLEKGYSLLFPHMRAHGESEGKYIGFGVLDAQDVKAWVHKMEDIFPGNDIFLHGVSMGAASVLNSADLFHNGEVCGIIGDCSFSSPHDVFCHLIGKMYHLPRFPFVGIFELANMILAHYDFHTYDVRCAMANSDVPSVYICGTEDKFVPLEMAQSIAACATESMIVEGGGHAASYMLETEKYKELVIGFINKYRRIS